MSFPKYTYARLFRSSTASKDQHNHIYFVDKLRRHFFELPLNEAIVASIAALLR